MPRKIYVLYPCTADGAIILLLLIAINGKQSLLSNSRPQMVLVTYRSAFYIQAKGPPFQTRSLALLQVPYYTIRGKRSMNTLRTGSAHFFSGVHNQIYVTYTYTISPKILLTSCSSSVSPLSAGPLPASSDTTLVEPSYLNPSLLPASFQSHGCTFCSHYV